MASRMRKQDVKRINTLLASQKQALDSLHIFQDLEQDESLNNRSHHIRNNYKYLQKIDRAEEMIKEAKHISEQRIHQARNIGIKKNKIKNQSSNALIHPIDEQPNPIPKALTALNPSQKETKVHSRQERNSFMENRAEDQISRIEDLKASREKQESILPQEIVEGETKKSIVDIDCSLVKNYFKEKMRGITSQTSPEQVYKMFHPFYELCGIRISLPLIKKYRNCAYFGQSNKQNELMRYEGFLIFHQEEKLYYGQLLNQKKNGRGTQIDFRNDAIYSGVFNKGRKVGVFKVTKHNQTYVGTLEKGEYHGYGELNNEFSQYKGHFERGLRHGEGQQRFLKIGLTICGTFINNTFTNNTQKLQQSRINTINKGNNKKSTIPSKVNPQSQHSYSKDKNVIFETSAYSRQNYQQFDYQFAGDEEEDEEIEIIKTQKIPTFRIKEVKQPIKSNIDRKRVASEQKLQFLYRNRKN